MRSANSPSRGTGSRRGARRLNRDRARSGATSGGDAQFRQRFAGQHPGDWRSGHCRLGRRGAARRDTKLGQWFFGDDAADNPLVAEQRGGDQDEQEDAGKTSQADAHPRHDIAPLMTSDDARDRSISSQKPLTEKRAAIDARSPDSRLAISTVLSEAMW